MVKFEEMKRAAKIRPFCFAPDLAHNAFQW